MSRQSKRAKFYLLQGELRRYTWYMTYQAAKDTLVYGQGWIQISSRGFRTIPLSFIYK